MARHIRLWSTAGVAASLLAISGCSAAATSPTPTKPAIADEKLAEVSDIITSVKAAPTFSAPGPAFDISALEGMTILNIPLNSTVPFNKIIDDAMAEAADVAGLKFIEYATQGQPSQWIQGVESGIAQGVDAIVLEGSPDPQLLGPQIQAAKDAGIPVISTHLYDESFQEEAMELNPSVTAFVPANHYRAGTLMADYAIEHSGGNVDALFIASNEVQPSAGIAEAFVAELARVCPDTCSAEVANIPIADWATKVPTAVQTALISDPDLNYIVPVFDGMTPNLVTGIAQVGRQADVSIIAYNGTASVMQMIAQQDLVVAEIGEPLEWLGWANIDQTLRVLSGTPALETQSTPLRLFDGSNIAEAGSPVNQTDGYGSADFRAGYQALWGLG
jgi:ribose transport system substrate-binding protein